MITVLSVYYIYEEISIILHVWNLNCW